MTTDIQHHNTVCDTCGNTAAGPQPNAFSVLDPLDQHINKASDAAKIAFDHVNHQYPGEPTPYIINQVLDHLEDAQAALKTAWDTLAKGAKS